jgi:hypothetical protein
LWVVLTTKESKETPMASRIFIEATASEVAELASELERIAGIAKECSSYMKTKGSDSYVTDGFNSAVEGIDAIVRLLGGVVGVYNAPPAKLQSIRDKLSAQRAAKKAAKAVEDSDALKRAQSSGNKTPKTPAKSSTKPTSQNPPTSRKKKA